MKTRYSLETFIEKAQKVHNYKYDYSLITEYTNITSFYKIICKIHGEFLQRGHSHLQGYGCSKCAKEYRTMDTEEFIRRAVSFHGNRYNYTKVHYRRINEKVEIICPQHGSFWMKPNTHLSQKSGCPVCSKNIANEKKKMSQEDFIKKAKDVHKNIYDYSEVKYLSSTEKVNIKCTVCKNFFKQKPSVHLQGVGCPYCKGTYLYNSKEAFIKKAKNIHGNKYDYSKVDYKNCMTPVEVKCPTHGFFYVKPNHHISSKSGCPFCRSSKREENCRIFFEERGIPFRRQVQFKDCRYKRILKFDFGLYTINNNLVLLLEIDGRQHTSSIDFFGGKKGLDYSKKRDSIKDRYCKEKGISLYRISYLDDIYNKLIEIEEKYHEQ